MSLSVGIVGLPNVGKSTLFNALTKRQQAAAENYPFCTIEPNSAIVEVQDPRLEALAAKEGLKFFTISAAAHTGLKELISYVGTWLDNYVEEPEATEEETVYDEDAARDAEKVTVTRNDAGDFIVSGKALEKLVAMTNFNNDEAIRRFQYIWRIKGIDEKLKERGIREGQTVHIGEMEFEWRE